MPHVIDGKRRQRIAAGTGTTVQQVNQLLEGRKQMAKMMKQMAGGKMPSLPGMVGPEREGGTMPAGPPRYGSKSRKKAKRKKSRAGRKRSALFRTERRSLPQQANPAIRGGWGRMRLTRVGSKKNPIYRVVVADSRSPRDGKFIEIVGRYNPQTDPSTIEFDEDRVRDWLGKGAQPSETVSRLLKIKNISL